MTLSRFLRDYLYIPLGGNRRGPTRRYVNLMITMLLGGLWHGAGWTFVLWGLYHGLLLLLAHAWREGLHGPRLPRPAGVLLTFLAVVLGWVLFRSESFAAARLMLEARWPASAPPRPRHGCRRPSTGPASPRCCWRSGCCPTRCS